MTSRKDSCMTKRERHQYILDRVAREGRVLTKEMVEEFNTAEDTVRKDFQELTAQGKVQRFHGGVLKIADEPLDFNDRITQQPTIKQQLAVRAVELVRDKHVLYIDGGTTNLKLAEMLPASYSGTVITNAPAVALALCDHADIEVILIGGNLNRTTKVITGTKAILQLQEVNIECCVLGVSSVSAENGITFPLSDEALLKREVLDHSKQVIVIANKEKLGSVSTFFAADISAIDIIVTNETDEDILQKYRSFDIEIISEEI